MIKNVFFISVIALISSLSALFSASAAEPQLVKTNIDRTIVNAQLIPDAVVVPEALHQTANKSYKVAGVRYTPQKSVKTFSEEGKASWYGKGFHGRKTASGERYDMNAMTAAHPTLPIPSYAKVTNLKNGKEVIVRINDRGPFHSNRVMDLSQAAAKKLEFMGQGVANVKVEQIVPQDQMSVTNSNGLTNL